MKGAIPVVDNKGSDSKISHHFAKAKFLVIYDCESFQVLETIKNKNIHRGGKLTPPLYMQSLGVSEVLVKGMGTKAFANLTKRGTKVYFGVKRNVSETLEAHKNKELRLGSPSDPALHSTAQEGKGKMRRRD